MSFPSFKYSYHTLIGVYLKPALVKSLDHSKLDTETFPSLFQWLDFIIHQSTIPQLVQQTVTFHTTTIPTTSVPTRPYVGNLPKCTKCSFHHKGKCREMHYKNCNEKGHTTNFCRVSAQQTACLLYTSDAADE